MDDSGHFRPDTDAIRLFDHFLSATGELPEEDLIAQILAEANQQLSHEAAREAETFLRQYLDYRSRGRILAQSAPVAEAPGRDRLARTFERIRKLRQEVFGHELASRLFADEEAQVNAALERRRIAAQAGLSEAERFEQLQAVMEELPVHLRESAERTHAVSNLRREEAALESVGGSPAQIRELREKRFGAEVADRLDELAEKRAAWYGRLQNYMESADAIRTDSSLTEEEQRERLKALREASFDERERLRVDAYERSLAAGANR